MAGMSPKNIKYRISGNWYQIHGIYKIGTGDFFYGPLQSNSSVYTSYGIRCNTSGIYLTSVACNANENPNFGNAYNVLDLCSKAQKLWNHNEPAWPTSFTNYLSTFNGKTWVKNSAGGHCVVFRNGHAIGYIYYTLQSGYNWSAGGREFFDGMPNNAAGSNTIYCGTGWVKGNNNRGLEISITNTHSLTHYCCYEITGGMTLVCEFHYCCTYTW